MSLLPCSTCRYLRGLSVSGSASKSIGIEVAAICVSTHLTLFTLKDDSAAAQAIESNVNALSERYVATLCFMTVSAHMGHVAELKTF